MMNKYDDKKLPSVIYSCYFDVHREGEQFVPEHVLTYQLAGTMLVYDGKKEYCVQEGSFCFARRNQLAKFVKRPPEGKEFRSVAVIIDQATLKDISIGMGYTAGRGNTGDNLYVLPSDKLIAAYMESLRHYESLPYKGNETLFSLKVKEAVLLLLRTHPQLKNVLFDFTEPGKIDLEQFMNRHFHFNVELKRFAYLTGRSLATFKRDFEKIFHLSPSRWLQQKRLEQAYYLIKQKGASPSDVYLEVGFENLSHFSFSFKKMYGVAPSRLA